MCGLWCDVDGLGYGFVVGWVGCGWCGGCYIGLVFGEECVVGKDGCVK